MEPVPLTLSLDRRGRVPVYRQIADALAGQIRRGDLIPGQRLPAARDLADMLGVSRVTATSAYEELAAAGLIVAHVGRGTFVAERPAIPAEPASGTTAGPPARDLLRLAERPGVISFAAGKPPPEFYPVHAFQRSVNAVLRRDGAAALDYEPTEGYRPLRQEIAHRLARQGTPTRPDDVLICSGSHQGIFLAASAMLQAGDRVLMERPTYVGAKDIFAFRGAPITAIPLDQHGLRVDLVEQAIEWQRPRLIYTLPTFHNPVGVSLALDRRRHLVDLARQAGIPVLEHDSYGELRYTGEALPTLRALDPGGNVVYLGSFSKVLLPGLRLGFLVASSPLFPWLRDAKQVADLHTPSIIQRAVHHFLAGGQLDRHLEEMRTVYRARQEALLAAMGRHLPDAVTWSRPDGGLYVWVAVPAHVSVGDLYLDALDAGVAFAAGQLFDPERADLRHFRLNGVLHPPDVAEEGIRRLGQVLRRHLARQPRPVAADQPVAPLV